MLTRCTQKGHGTMRRDTFALLAVTITTMAAARPAPGADDLDLTPITPAPEPVGDLHPKVRWMTEQKIRLMWIGDNLFDRFGAIDVPAREGETTKGDVLKEKGFNVVSISMGPNSDGDADSTTLNPRTVDPKHDRSRSTDLEQRLAPNVAAARRYGLKLLVGWKYGTHHLEPYRKYRGPDGKVARRSCCPLDETYIAGQHVGRWAVRAAELGADGINIDIEMYQSDAASYPGPCFCDDCFATYLAAFARDPQGLYDGVPPEQRGRWIADRQGTHYAAFAARRVEALWDGIRRRCQAVNPAFIMAQYHTLEALPGMERGLGTSSVPCPLLDAHEYHHGPYRGSFIGVKRVRENLPVLFVSGLYVKVQSPQQFAASALQACLYTDGYFAWYGTALLNAVGPGEEKEILPGPYGRWGTSSAADYLDRLAATHARLDTLLAAPRDTWPERVDGKLLALQEKARAAEAERARSETAETRQAAEEAAQELKRYMGLVAQGGY